MTNAEAERLAAEEAEPNLVAGRWGWDSTAVAATLNPERLAALLLGARQGNPENYLTLAIEMEERDLVYRSSLATRKLAVVGLPAIVEPASEAAEDLEIAAAVQRDIVDRPSWPRLLLSCLDALAKGFSAVEMIWQTEQVPWFPQRYEHRDPRWFRYDRESGRRLLLWSGGAEDEGTPLEPMKWVIHEPELISGLPIRRGLAMPAAYLHLAKFASLASWAAFLKVFGYPLRIGKYSKHATAADQRVLRRAIQNIGRDLGAIMPDDMVIEIVNAIAPGGSIEHYERLCNWADRQIEIGVLGQTATTEGTPGRLGSDAAQDQVRKDILVADAREVAATAQGQIVVPYVDLNFGARKVYPRVRLPVPDREDVKTLAEAVSKLVGAGLRVKQKEVRGRLGLSEPEEDDEILDPTVFAPAAPAPAAAPAAARSALAGLRAEDTTVAGAADELAALVAEEEWEPLAGPIHAAVERLARDCASYDELRDRLPELLGQLGGGRITERLAAASLKAHALGDRDFEAE